jgi:hypothetical protein
MRNLFSRDEDGRVIVLPQAWLLEPFAAIRDKYKEAGIADIELALVWYASDYRSDFLEGAIVDRVANIKSKIYGQRNIKIDDVTYKAIQFYMDEQDTPKIKLVRALQSALAKATATIELTAMNNLDDIKIFSDIVTKLPGMIENIDKVDALVKKETSIDGKVVGTGEKGMYEDG